MLFKTAISSAEMPKRSASRLKVSPARERILTIGRALERFVVGFRRAWLAAFGCAFRLTFERATSVVGVSCADTLTKPAYRRIAVTDRTNTRRGKFFRVIGSLFLAIRRANLSSGLFETGD